MTEADLLEFTHKYREVRRHDPRRLYITTEEWRAILTNQRYLVLQQGDMRFDGALMIRYWNDDVVAAIRAWDLLPYGSET